jgi:hypothetical protein
MTNGVYKRYMHPAQQSNTGNPSPIYSVEGGGGDGDRVPFGATSRTGTDRDIWGRGAIEIEI